MDYFQILNLQREPFSNSPEPDFFFHSDPHVSCLQRLELAIRLRRGLNVVMGNVGTGKTTLCRQLILNVSRTDEDRAAIETHLILDPSFSDPHEFLSAVARLLGVADPEDCTEWQLKETIKTCLFQRGIDERKIVVLLIDEGQKLPDFCREILREFLNYETNEHKLLQIVIFAQEEFKRILQAYPNFADRVNQYVLLKPLNFRETVKLVRFRLHRAGADSAAVPALFTGPAFWAVYRGTSGYPRKIITLCHQVLLAMIIQNRAKAGFPLVRSCAGRVSPAESPRRFRWGLTFTAAVLLAFLIINNYETIGYLPPRFTGKPEAKSNHDKLPGGKIPEILGRLTVKQDDRVLRMLQRIYGKRNAINELEAVAKANPEIEDMNLIAKDDVITIPARKDASHCLPVGNYWVQIVSFDNLNAAYELLRGSESPGLTPLMLLSYWHEQEGTVFAVMLNDGFSDEAAALRAIEALSPSVAGRARVVSSWREGTLFL